MDPEVSPAKVRIGAIRWYAGKARSNRGRFFWIRGYQILVASVIPLVSLFGAWSAQRYVSAALGASIAIAEGLQQLGQFQQCLNQPPNQAMSVSSTFTKNVTTDSPWPISSSTDAKYNDPSRPDCNLRIPLWQLVRASTAVRCFSHLRCCCSIAVIPPRRLCS